MESFGERVRKRRVAKGISCIQLAEMTGMKQPSISKMENGRTGRTLDKLPLLAKALGCRIDDLFPEMDGYTPEAETPSRAPDPPGKPADSRNAAATADTDAHAPTGDAAPAVPSKPTTAALDADNWWELLGLEL